MAVARATVVKLLNAPEYRLYEASRRGRVDDHGAQRLRAMIGAARKLLDKYRALSKTQKGQVRGKRASAVGRPAQSVHNTERKQAIFADVLERLEAALQKAEARLEPARPEGRVARRRRGDKASRAKAARQARAESSDTAKKSAAKKGAAKKSAAKKGAAKKGAAKKGAAKKGAAKKGAAKKRSAKQTSAKKKPVTKAARRKVAAKAAARDNASTKAIAAQGPKGAARARKSQVAATRTRLAHGRARGQRRQARRGG
jgi:hypothetical protein